MKRAYFSKGQTMVEAIVVIAIVVLLVMGLIAGTTTSLRSASAGRAKSQALKFAEEGVEFVRNLRDARWATLVTYNGLYCLGNENDNKPELLPPTGSTCVMNITTVDGTYSRGITFSSDGQVDPKITVEVSVRYPDGSQTKEVTLTTLFTNWK